jgi:alkylation response protein AidB-like acyl-CoA dehydrogenase
MNFGFTEEQELLRNEVRKFLDENCPLEEVRKISESSEGFSRELWKQIAELGWLGLTVPEEHGGSELGWVDLVVILEETGRTLFPSPLISTTLAAAAIRESGSAEQQARWLPRFADGSAIGTLAFLEADDIQGPEGIRLRPADGTGLLSGEKLFVCDAGVADLFVVALRSGDGPADLSLAVLERGAEGLSSEDLPGIDLTKRLGRVSFDGVHLATDAMLVGGGPAGAAISRLQDLGATALAAEMIGAAEAALQLTVSYAGERVQFGQPIGTFQGVKHPLAEMYVDIESFKSLVYYAAWCLDEGQEDAALATSRAKAYASEALARIGLDAIQLHGGIAYTWEYDAQLFLKRSKWARPIFGDADYHYERIASLGGL